MTALIGVRREDKSEWERRVPITPEHAAQLTQQGIEVILQTSDLRAYDDREFVEAGIPVQEDLSGCPIILGIKEVPKHLIQAGKTYMFFAHVIKGQPYNMPMLQRLLDQGCTLIDYERVVDENNRRLIFFGWHAGVAGTIDTLWALGQRLAWEGIPNPFSTLRLTHQYRDLADAKIALAEVRVKIQTEGLPAALAPMIVGVAGYGNVSRGAQEMLDLLPVLEVEPEEIADLIASDAYSRHHLYKVVFKEEHTVEPGSPDMEFQLQDYYDHPEKYRGIFGKYLPHLTVLINAIFWTERYPRLVTREALRDLFSAGPPRLRVIGDVSCDVEGAVECTVKCTEPGDPVFVYDPLSGSVQDGYEGRGVVIMAVDILPSELPREASSYFGQVLLPYLPAIARCDYDVPFEDCNLPAEIKRAVIAYQGSLTPDYQYIGEYL